MLLDDLLPHPAKARYLPDLAPDVAYSVQPGFVAGSLRKAKPNDRRDQTVAILNPSYARKQQALGLDVETNPQSLLRYYADVLRLMRQHRVDMTVARRYFWLQPVLLSKGKPVITFPWYDTYPEAASLLWVLQRPAADGLLFDDLDQGWSVAIYVQGERVYLVEGDDTGLDWRTLCCTDRARLAQLAAATLARTQQQLASFVQATGQNPWRYSA